MLQKWTPSSNCYNPHCTDKERERLLWYLTGGNTASRWRNRNQRWAGQHDTAKADSISHWCRWPTLRNTHFLAAASAETGQDSDSSTSKWRKNCKVETPGTLQGQWAVAGTELCTHWPTLAISLCLSHSVTSGHQVLPVPPQIHHLLLCALQSETL